MFTGPQLHLILNHLPIVGFVLMTPLLILAIFSQRSEYKRLALLGATAVGLLALPAFWTGEPAEEGIEDMPGVSEPLIEAHEEAAEVALTLALVTAGIAAAAWIATRRGDKLLTLAMPLVTVAALATTGTMAWVGHEGGKIRHPEIAGKTSVTPAQGETGEGREAGEDQDDD